jgi:hypothetical protein
MKTKREKSVHILHSRNILLEKNIQFSDNKSFYYYYIWGNRLKNDIHPQFLVLCTVYIIVLRFPSFYSYQFQL